MSRITINRTALLLVVLAFSAHGINAQLASEIVTPALAPRPILLRNRIFTPPAGIDPILVKQAKGVATANARIRHLIVQFRETPEPGAWQLLESTGIVKVSHLGENNWIVSALLFEDLTVYMREVVRVAGVAALTSLQPMDKAAPRLLRRPYEPWAWDPETGLLKVVVQFFPDTPAASVQRLVMSFHRGKASAVPLSPTFWSLQVLPADLERLLASDEVHDVDLGPLPYLPLMRDARWKTGTEEVQKIDLSSTSLYAQGLSGKGVRISNNEGLDVNHDDFWNHDATGQRTTPRWLSTGPSTCRPYGSNPHGTMTAGIALGNGFQSSSRGGSSYQWRGIAPDAIYDCGSTADVANRSIVQTYGEYDSSAAYIDSAIRGDQPGAVPRPQVWAVANQGIDSQWARPPQPNENGEKGYYSVYAPAKNPIVVANVSANTLRWMFSSIGPTWDGRIKPDLAAPGTKGGFPENRTQLLFDLDSLKVVQGSRSLLWTFNGTQPNWHGGWAQDDSWLGRIHLGPVTQVTEGSVQALRAPLKSGPYGNGFDRAPLLGTLTQPNGSTLLNITGKATDTVEIRYRIESDPHWRPARVIFTWDVDPPKVSHQYGVDFNVVSDGAWHTVVIPVGKEPTWNGLSGINYLFLRFEGAGMLSAAHGGGYTNAGGSSAAAPVVSGAVALLMEQMGQKFGVQLGTFGNSPFWHGAPGKGVPLPSTFKALLVQGARDLAYLPHADEPNNPDTQAPTVYHEGPDLVTGYGIIDVAESVRVVAAHSTTQPYIVERAIASGQEHVYNLMVPTSPRAPIKVTLAWDDKAADPLWEQVARHLVNDINLTLVAPDKKVYFPYSIDPPYSPSDPAQYPGVVEPEPITAADIRRARQDKVNDRDNLEQVLVENPQPGVWQVRVKGFQLYAPPQKYSLVLGTPPRPASSLHGGKVVFNSNRVNPPQLFVQKVGSSQPPQQVTTHAFGARNPEWSRNGKYIVYVTKDVIVGPQSTQVDMLAVMDESGAMKYWLHAPTFSVQSIGYPRWSDDGRRIAFSFWQSWGERGLGLITFPAPYQFGAPVLEVLVPLGYGVNDLDPAELVFSRDGRYVYFNADSGLAAGGLFRIPVTGGAPTPVYGNAAPIVRAYAPSLSPDGTRILYNSELWRDDPAHYQDEELLEVNLVTGVIRQVTAEPGNQYGYFAKNGTGEYIVQSDATPADKTDLFLEQNGIRVTLDVADPKNAYDDDTPDWWKSPCDSGAVLWAGDEAVGCQFPAWSPEAKSVCGAWTPLATTGSGYCAVCIEASWVDPVLDGAWNSLTQGSDITTAKQADLSCLACFKPPANLIGWWPLDEATGPVADLQGGPSGTRIGGVSSIYGRVKGGLKLNGRDGYVEVPTSIKLSLEKTDFSIGAWVRISSANDFSGIHVLVEKRQQDPWRGYSLFLYSGAPGLQLADGVGSQYDNYISTTKIPADGAWHFVVVTVDRDNPAGGRFYLDGDLAGAPFNPTARQGSLGNTRPLRFGSRTVGAAPSGLFKGSIDEVELFGRALTPYEVQRIYAAGPFGKCKP